MPHLLQNRCLKYDIVEIDSSSEPLGAEVGCSMASVSLAEQAHTHCLREDSRLENRSCICYPYCTKLQLVRSIIEATGFTISSFQVRSTTVTRVCT